MDSIIYSVRGGEEEEAAEAEAEAEEGRDQEDAIYLAWHTGHGHY